MACRCVNHITKKCLNCGFSFSLCRYRRKEAKYCSSSCRTTHLIKSGKLLQCISKRIKRICLVCKKEFEVKKYREKTAMFCSFSCSGKYKHIIDPELGYRAGKILAGKPKPWLRGRKQSLESRLKRSIALRGENGPNWQGGKTKEFYTLRHGLAYKLWREKVFTRDNYICQFCGERGKKLNADHIRAFSQYPELRFLVTNGRTLCIDCHKQTDNYAWRAAYGT